MKKAYFIVKSQIINPADEEIFDEFTLKVRDLAKDFGGELLLQGKKIENVLGFWKPDRLIVFVFESKTKLLECFNSPEYIQLTESRGDSVISETIAVEE
jgi:uncharacterized protein (DUF1330 family)